MYDSSKRMARFYLNGVFGNETRQTIAYPAHHGPDQVGNWINGARKLNDRIDELLLPGWAMNDTEINLLCGADNLCR